MKGYGGILSLLLALVLLSGCAPAAEPSAPAEESLRAAQAMLEASGSQGSPETVAQVAEDLERLEVTMLRDLVRVAEVGPQGITYAIDYDQAGITDLLRVTGQEDGSVTVTITEGEKEDVFHYPSNGTVELNGARLTGCDPLDRQETPQKGRLTYHVEAAPAALFTQDIGSMGDLEDLIPGKKVTFCNLAVTVPKVNLPAAAEELTFSALLNVMGSHAANRLVDSLTNPSAEGFRAAVGEALRNGRDEAAAVFQAAGASETLSYKLLKYAVEADDPEEEVYLYAIDCYGRSYWYGQQFLWGIREVGQPS